jgi:hypothetical protein
VTLTSKQLLHRLYFDRPFIEAARTIGYEGRGPLDFWDQAQKLGIPQQQLLDAIYELTRIDRRGASPPRYELREDVKHFCWQLLGPPPEKQDAFWRHPDGTPMERQKKKWADESEEAQAEPEKKARKPRGRGMTR